jgi:hypothetical protein
VDRLLRRPLGVLVFLFGAYCAVTAGVLLLSAAFNWNEVDLNCGGKAQLGVLFALGALNSGWVLVELLPRRRD